MTKKKQDIINRFATIIKQSSSYEEFYLECMADNEMSAFLNKLSSCYLAPGSKIVEEISSHELYRSLKNLVEDVDAYGGLIFLGDNSQKKSQKKFLENQARLD